MSYYAEANGEIVPNNELAGKAIMEVLIERKYFEWYLEPRTNTIVLWQYDKYWEEEYDYLFEHIRGLVKRGFIRLRGEGCDDWCFEFNSDSGDWEEKDGRIVYDNGSINELVAALVEGFEDFLTEKGIWFPNPERDGDDPNVDREGASLIYGTDYGALQTHIEDTLRHFGLI